jgi:hypothetical protein
MCVHVCMYVCMYAMMWRRLCYRSASLRDFIHVCLCMFTNVYVCVCVYVCLHACLYVYVYVCMHGIIVGRVLKLEKLVGIHPTVSFLHLRSLIGAQKILYVKSVPTVTVTLTVHYFLCYWSKPWREKFELRKPSTVWLRAFRARTLSNLW